MGSASNWMGSGVSSSSGAMIVNVSVQNGRPAFELTKQPGTPVDSALSAIITQLGNGAASSGRPVDWPK